MSDLLASLLHAPLPPIAQNANDPPPLGTELIAPDNINSLNSATILHEWPFGQLFANNPANYEVTSAVEDFTLVAHLDQAMPMEWVTYSQSGKNAKDTDPRTLCLNLEVDCKLNPPRSPSGFTIAFLLTTDAGTLNDMTDMLTEQSPSLRPSLLRAGEHKNVPFGSLKMIKMPLGDSRIKIGPTFIMDKANQDKTVYIGLWVQTQAGRWKLVDGRAWLHYYSFYQLGAKYLLFSDPVPTVPYEITIMSDRTKRRRQQKFKK
ncbi:hypothetical protein BC828DRAFT_371726 [Blastocladiella britannica]|nr:hypothetical protein BC828DRAFT_371726 [Blastocladiella britannica]